MKNLGDLSDFWWSTVLAGLFVYTVVVIAIAIIVRLAR